MDFLKYSSTKNDTYKLQYWWNRISILTYCLPEFFSTMIPVVFKKAEEAIFERALRTKLLTVSFPVSIDLRRLEYLLYLLRILWSYLFSDNRNIFLHSYNFDLHYLSKLTCKHSIKLEKIKKSQGYDTCLFTRNLTWEKSDHKLTITNFTNLWNVLQVRVTC